MASVSSVESGGCRSLSGKKVTANDLIRAVASRHSETDLDTARSRAEPIEIAWRVWAETPLGLIPIVNSDSKRTCFRPTKYAGADGFSVWVHSARVCRVHRVLRAGACAIPTRDSNSSEQLGNHRPARLVILNVQSPHTCGRRSGRLELEYRE